MKAHTAPIPNTKVEITKDLRGFVFVGGVKLGRITPDGLQIKGKDLREPYPTDKFVIVPLSDLICFLGTLTQT